MLFLGLIGLRLYVPPSELVGLCLIQVSGESNPSVILHKRRPKPPFFRATTRIFFHRLRLCIQLSPFISVLSSNPGGPITQFHPTFTPEALEEKVILIVGGANGIGESLVELCCQNGAYVCIGDIDSTHGAHLSLKCCEKWPVYSDPNLPPKPPRSTFQPVDITDYHDVLGLFDFAFKTYKRIDHVVVTAGSMEPMENWFDSTLSLQAIRTPPSTKDLDVNLTGSLYVVRVASVYLRHNRGPWVDRSIILFSCAAGFKETPGVSVYQAAKHGVQGLMRSLRPYFCSPYKHNLRINTICPWMTQSHTAVTKTLCDRWEEEGLPISSATEVAQVTAGVLADDTLNGTSMYVKGGRAWEMEENITRLEPQWLGEAPSETLARGQKVLKDTWAA
ncbi:NAD(P)-binding protein [Aspergillus sclerotiicarbonarius CBS 121057]|uniref:NAD(P)-binding protein n=1 Tax=Aspergillus sclerotiicarbonarius (strain CBS 121057 / IBT 28362) TaxID=1448318 RepID=A0A319DSL1_ASPSB|nr:NAD(P)-binding protein [Aspergillus sclerotiicarbonarius CBS 121057]